MMLNPLSATQGELMPHWNTLTADIVPRLDPRSSGVTLKPAPVHDQLVLSFVGQATRRAGRLRGNPMPVVPFCAINSNWEVWLGYREVWKILDGQPNKFEFSSSDLTVFFAPIGSETFMQMLRAEWSGLGKRGDEWSFMPANAGHPHWQVDITETLQVDADLKAARELLMDTEPKEFGANATPSQIPPWSQIGRIHFPSAMRPWADTIIAHGPAGLGAVRAWVVNTVGLLRIELGRV